MPKSLPDNVLQAIKCGPAFKYRDWRRVKQENWTKAERAMAFVEHAIPLPDGPKVGQKVKKLPFQEAAFYQIYDTSCWMYFLSDGRKNAKTQTAADIVAPKLFMPGLASRNSNIAVAANSRDQASHFFQYMVKSLQLSRELDGLYHVIPSSKSIIGLEHNVTLKCISADAARAHGGQYEWIIYDELAQASSTGGMAPPFFDALVTGQGTQEEPKFIVISTQAGSDDHIMSTLMDTAIASNSKDTAVHLYAADADCALDDEEQWKKANPALGPPSQGFFRSRKDIQRQCADAMSMTSAEARFRLLILNQRVSSETLWLAPTVWKENRGAPDWDLFREKGVHLGIDLSMIHDLTVASLGAKDDDGNLHIYPIGFTPERTAMDRQRRDKIPYTEWIRSGELVGVPGEVIDYDYVAEYLKANLQDEGIAIHGIHFDRWNISRFRNSAERCGFAQGAEWFEVGQGFKDISPRMQTFETALLQRKVRHGGHPLFNLAASSAVRVQDPSGNSKMDKNKSGTRGKIDALIAAIMAAHPLLAEIEKGPIASIGWV